MASELSELRAELWRTRDNLERMKSRTPPSAGQSSHRLFNRRHHADGKIVDRENAEPQRPNERDRVKDLKLDRCAGGGVRSGPTSPPSGGSSRSDQNNGRSGDGIAAGRGFSEEMAAEETLSSLALEGAAFKNWTEEASSIAVRLIEEVKTLRWERVTWTEREAATERAATELKERTEALERRLLAAEDDARRTKEALLRAQDGEREQARATERAEQDLRAARKRSEERWGRADGLEGRDTQVGRSLREELRREKEGADALQRRLDQARAASARHEVEKKEWHASRERLEELRRLWGKQLRKVEKKVRTMAKENKALQERVAEADKARECAEADARRSADELRRLTEQRDNLLLGATRAGHLSASSPADALAELLAAAAAGVVAGAGGDDHAAARRSSAHARGSVKGGAWGWADKYSDGAGGDSRAEDLEAELERARAEAKLARVAVKQERLRREGAAKEKDEAVRQLRRLMGAAKRAVSRKDARLRSSRMETEVVWNALTEAVR